MGGLISQFNWIDVVAVILLMRLGYMGGSLGLSAELTKFLGVFIGLFVSFHWYHTVGEWASARSVLTPEWAGAIALILLVFSAYLAVVLAIRLMQKAVTVQFAPSLNKIGGIAVGLLRAGVVMSVVLVALQQLPSEYLRTSIQERSWSGRYLVRVGPTVYDIVTPWISRHVPIGPPGNPQGAGAL